MNKAPKAPRTEKQLKESRLRDFNDFVERESKRRGIPKEQAQKEGLHGLFGQFASEQRRERAIGSTSEVYGMLDVALEAQLDKKGLQELSQSGKADPHFRPFSLLPATPDELYNTGRFLEKKFEGATIRYAVVAEYTDLNRELIGIAERLSADPDFLHAPSFAVLRVSHPHLMADIARMREIQQAMKRHESQLAAQINAHEKLEEAKKQARGYLMDGFLTPLADFFKASHRHVQRLSEGQSFMSFLINGTPGVALIVAELVPLAWKMGTATAKLFAAGAQATYAGVRRT